MIKTANFMLGTSYHKKRKKKKDLELCYVKTKMAESMNIKNQDRCQGVISYLMNF